MKQTIRFLSFLILCFIFVESAEAARRSRSSAKLQSPSKGNFYAGALTGGTIIATSDANDLLSIGVTGGYRPLNYLRAGLLFLYGGGHNAMQNKAKTGDDSYSTDNVFIGADVAAYPFVAAGIRNRWLKGVYAGLRGGASMTSLTSYFDPKKGDTVENNSASVTQGVIGPFFGYEYAFNKKFTVGFDMALMAALDSDANVFDSKGNELPKAEYIVEGEAVISMLFAAKYWF